ncbi:MAG TPA: phosphatase PAP2 family protein [Rhizomicrobium sp.]|nr:phosphatase PAP2 family protein [Rhizomicrobium sp.]
MRKAGSIFACLLLWPVMAQAALLAPSEVDASRFLPPPPAARSAAEKAEFRELHAIAARSSKTLRAIAAHDAKDESPDIFNRAIGLDIATKPATFKLLQLVVEEEDVDSKLAKAFFHRPRPYSVDKKIKTCEPVKPGKAANSYPSGHASLSFSMGVVLASLLPEKSQAILARASEYAEHRLVCGVHFRSDIAAGQQFGTILALKLMQNPVFQAQMALARDEWAARP